MRRTPKTTNLEVWKNDLSSIELEHWEKLEIDLNKIEDDDKKVTVAKTAYTGLITDQVRTN